MSSDGPAQSSLRRPFFVANQAVFSGCWKFSPGFPQNSKTFPPSAPTCPRNGVFRALRGRLRTGLLQSSTATEAGLGARGSPERKASTSGLARPGHDRSAKEAGPQGPVSGPGSGCTDPQGPVRTRTHPNRRDRTSRKGGDQEAPITARPSGGALAPASKPGCAEGDDLRVPAGSNTAARHPALRGRGRAVGASSARRPGRQRLLHSLRLPDTAPTSACAGCRGCACRSGRGSAPAS